MHARPEIQDGSRTGAQRVVRWSRRVCRVAAVLRSATGSRWRRSVVQVPASMCSRGSPRPRPVSPALAVIVRLRRRVGHDCKPLWSAAAGIDSLEIGPLRCGVLTRYSWRDVAPGLPVAAAAQRAQHSAVRGLQNHGHATALSA